MPSSVPKYTIWEALNVAIATGMRALEEVRTLARIPAPPAKMPTIRAWADNIHYEGDIVAFDGRTYQALRDTGRSPEHDDWICLAERGKDGANGRGPVPRGLFDDATEYAELDIVMLNGASFIARKDKPGPCPGEGWFLLAKQGKPGQSIKGDRGPAVPVRAMSINDDGLLSLTNADGSVVTCDLYPLLTRLK